MEVKGFFAGLLSVLIIMGTFASFIFVAYNLIGFVVLARPFSGLPDIVYHDAGDRNIILRVDDIQGFVLRDIQKEIINDSLDRGYTMTLGVIPSGLIEDRELLRFLIDRRGKIEIALHGLDNEFNEFNSLSYEDALEKIEDGLAFLSFLEPHIITFIPPNNEYSESTFKVLNEKGILLSAGYWNSEYGFNATTYNWDDKEIVSYEEILNECKKSLDENGLCVVMIHPQDFATDDVIDNEKYDNYLRFLDGIEGLDANVINFRDLAEAKIRAEYYK